jgi:hypothetical protein
MMKLRNQICSLEAWVKVFSILPDFSFFFAKVQTVLEIRLNLMSFFVFFCGGGGGGDHNLLH